jgi:hypothetical protein
VRRVGYGRELKLGASVELLLMTSQTRLLSTHLRLMDRSISTICLGLWVADQAPIVNLGGMRRLQWAQEILLALPKRYITEKMTRSVNNHLKALTGYSN